MTTRNEGRQRILEWKAALLGRIARLAMTSRDSGLDGLAKSLLQRNASGPPDPDPELEHPAEWDRPVD